MATITVEEPYAEDTLAMDDNVVRDTPFIVAGDGDYAGTDGGGGQYSYGHA